MLKIILAVFICIQVQASEVVYVGLYNFPPFAEITETKAEGAAIDLIHLLNEKLIQSNIELRPFFTSPKRRYQDFKENKFDYLFFESKDWGWSPFNLESTSTIATGGEKYLSLKSDSTEYTKANVDGKKIAGILGYHYGFAKLDSNEEELKRKYNIVFTNDHSKNIDLVVKKRVDVAIITESYFKIKARNDKKLYDKLKLSSQYDQVYEHKILGRSDSKLSINLLIKAMDELRREKKLKMLEKKYFIKFN